MVLIELAKLMPKMNFVVAMNVGDRAIYDRVREAASKLPNVKFLGSVPFEDIDPLFANAKLLIHTATIEGFPNTYLQTLQYGKPVISVNIDPDGILSEQGLGMCLFNDDSHLAMSNTELAYKLKIAIHEIESKYFDYAERCRRYIALNHLPDICTDKLIKVLETS